MRILNLGGFKCFDEHIQIKYKTSVFPNGSVFFRLENLSQLFYLKNPERVLIYTRLNNSEEIMRLVMAVDALRRAGTEKMECYIPDIPYAQQDRVCSLGESLSLKVFANIINDLKFSKVYTWDAHSNACSLLIDNFVDYGNSQYISNVLLLLKNKYGYKEFNFISPDAGASKKISRTLSSINCLQDQTPLILQCEKVRDPLTNLLTKTVCPNIPNGNPCLIVDDICIGGRTFLNIAENFREQGNINKLYLACTHAPFPEPINMTIDKLKKQFDMIYISNSRNDDFMKNGKYYDLQICQIPLF